MTSFTDYQKEDRIAWSKGKNIALDEKHSRVPPRHLALLRFFSSGVGFRFNQPSDWQTPRVIRFVYDKTNRLTTVQVREHPPAGFVQLEGSERLVAHRLHPKTRRFPYVEHIHVASPSVKSLQGTLTDVTFWG